MHNYSLNTFKIFKLSGIIFSMLFENITDSTVVIFGEKCNVENKKMNLSAINFIACKKTHTALV